MCLENFSQQDTRTLFFANCLYVSSIHLSGNFVLIHSKDNRKLLKIPLFFAIHWMLSNVCRWMNQRLSFQSVRFCKSTLNNLSECVDWGKGWWWFLVFHIYNSACLLFGNEWCFYLFNFSIRLMDICVLCVCALSTEWNVCNIWCKWILNLKSFLPVIYYII